MRIELLIGSLETGGSQVQMALLAEGLARRGHLVTVTTLFPGGAVAERLRGAGTVKLRSLFPGKSGFRPLVGLQLLRSPFVLRRSWPRHEPAVYHSMLDITNLVAAVALGRRRSRRLIWGVRGSNNRLSALRQGARWLCAKLSGRVGVLLSNSHAGLKHHEGAGFRSMRHLVLANGIDTDRFRPGSAAAVALRRSWGGDDFRVIGLIGRVAPVKDHETFLQAAARLVGRDPSLRFVCVGGGKPEALAGLRRRVRELGLADRCRIAGEVGDMPAVYGALDLLVLSSFGEGFPNVLAEGMACGLPCVTTDVGDARAIVSEHDVVVPPRNPEALAAGIERRLADLSDVPEGPRRHILERFSVDSMLDRFEDIARSLVSDGTKDGGPPAPGGTGS